MQLCKERERERAIAIADELNGFRHAIANANVKTAAGGGAVGTATCGAADLTMKTCNDIANKMARLFCYDGVLNSLEADKAGITNALSADSAKEPFTATKLTGNQDADIKALHKNNLVFREAIAAYENGQEILAKIGSEIVTLTKDTKLDGKTISGLFSELCKTQSLG